MTFSSVGLQAVLARAASDPSFRDELLARRADAASSIGIALSVSEAAVLASVPEPQLVVMIDELAKVASRDSPAGFVEEPTRGIRPDLPEGIPACGGIRPDFPSQGIRPDLDYPTVSRGHSSKVPLILGGAVLVGGAIALTALTAGIKPDVPPQPAAKPLAPDAGPAAASQPVVAKPDVVTPPKKR